MAFASSYDESHHLREVHRVPVPCIAVIAQRNIVVVIISVSLAPMVQYVFNGVICVNLVIFVLLLVQVGIVFGVV